MTKTPKRPKPAYGEPWTSDTAALWDANDTPLCHCDDMTPELHARIAACVNFCRQFPTAWLETHQLHYADSAVNAAQVQNYAGLVIVTRNDDQNTTREHQNHA